MKLPESVKQIRARYVAAFPVPTGEPGEAHEEHVRQWSTRFAEQVAFELPGQGWGMKRADPTRPISKDTIAQQRLAGVIRIWDLLIGTGTGNPRLAEDPESDDLTGQTFVVVQPTNHLGAVTTPPPAPSPEPAPSTVDLSAIVRALAALHEEMSAQRERDNAIRQAQAEDHTALAARIETLAAAMSPQPIAWVGRLFGYTLRLTPDYPQE